MNKLKSWIGLCALLMSFQVHGNEVEVEDAWIRPLATGQADAMFGMVIKSDRQARIIGVISRSYSFVAMQGPSESGGNKTQEIGYIELPAQKSVVLSAEGAYFLLSGNKKMLAADEKIPVIITVQFDNKTRKTITIMAQPLDSNGVAIMPVISNVAAQISPAKPEVTSRPPVAEVKPIKAAPVAVPKPARVPAPVKASSVAAPLSVPVVVVKPAVAPILIEPKISPEAKLAEQAKQDEARANADCLSLAEELRSCDRSNDLKLEWCETTTKSRYTCKFTMEQLKKLRN